MTRASQRTGMSGIFKVESHARLLPPTAGGAAGDSTGSGGRPPPPPAASGPLGALGRSLGHGEPSDGAAPGPAKRSISASRIVLSSGDSAPLAASPGGGAPAIDFCAAWFGTTPGL